MKYSYCFFLFFGWLVAMNGICAQTQKFHFVYQNNNSPITDIKNITNLTTLNDTLNRLGYYFFSTTKELHNGEEIYHVNLGPKINTITITNLTKDYQKIFKTNQKHISISVENFETWMQQCNNFFDKQGKNFTKTQLIHIKKVKDTLLGEIAIQKSTPRYIDKVMVKGYPNFSKRHQKYFLHSKKPFSKQTLIATEKKINQLSFVKNQKKPAVLFTKDSTYLYVYLQKVKTNRLDALLGFTNQETQNKLVFNGYIDLSLTNTLHKGETFAFTWNNSGQNQQELEVLIDNPYIFNSPINAGYQLNIFRQDSTFTNTQQHFKIGYKPHYQHLINAYYKTETSTTLRTVSNQTEYNKTIFGLTYTYTEINSWRIPKIKIHINTAFGNRKTTQSIPQQFFSSDLIYNLEINQNNHIYLQNRNGYLRSKNKLTNELYRIGGALTMRGFLEQSIVTHLYDYANLEYRYFNNPISYLYLFSDVGHFRNLEQQNNLLSFGLGYTLGTPSGLLKISYAVGKNQNTNFNLNSGLFHLNFVTIF